MANPNISEDDLRARVRELLKETHPDKVDQFTFRGNQYDHGLAWVNFPVGYGGLALSPDMQNIVDNELAKHAKKQYNIGVNPIGIMMGGPTVLTHGTEWMRNNLMRRIFTGEDIWCQLFSEPSAGSDLAGLATRAVREGDYWVLNGQKVWTSVAHLAKWGMLVARTNPDVPKHAGMSYFLLDMKAPGVDVRPLYQITGDAEFNEVFMTDVKIPADHMFGIEGDGWKVALTTLMNERTGIGGLGSSQPGGGAIDMLISLWKSRDALHFTKECEAIMRDRIAKLYIESQLLNVTTKRSSAARTSGNPGPEGSILKVASADLNKRIGECLMDVMGSQSLVYEAGFERTRSDSKADESLHGRAKYFFLRARGNSIEGGTSEVMRNILGERVLGLPGEPRADKDIPWKNIPR